MDRYGHVEVAVQVPVHAAETALWKLVDVAERGQRQALTGADAPAADRSRLRRPRRFWPLGQTGTIATDLRR